MIAAPRHSYIDHTGSMVFDQIRYDQTNDAKRFGGNATSSRVLSCVGLSAVSAPVIAAIFPVAKALFVPLSSLSSLSAALLLDLLLLRGPWAIR